MTDQVQLVIAGVEGGGVTLYGRRTSNGWRYRVSYVDQTPLMLDEPEIRREYLWVESWEEALAEMDRQGWCRLPGVMVHREFRERIWKEIQKRFSPLEENTGRRAQMLAQWRERCGIEEPQ